MTREPYWYIASPYAGHPAGIEAAFEEVCKATASLLCHGIRVYSPIAHTHPIALYGALDPRDHSIWLPADGPLMQAAVGIIVIKMDGWDVSKGIAHEVKQFQANARPVLYMEWPQ